MVSWRCASTITRDLRSCSIRDINLRREASINFRWTTVSNADHEFVFGDGSSVDTSKNALCETTLGVHLGRLRRESPGLFVREALRQARRFTGNEQRIVAIGQCLTLLLTVHKRQTECHVQRILHGFQTTLAEKRQFALNATGKVVRSVLVPTEFE